MTEMLAAATRGRRHPHQVLIAIMCVLVGLPILFGGPRPGSIAAALPLPLVYVWGAVLVVCGSLVVAAAAVRKATSALYFELVADLPLAIMTAVYAVAVLSSVGLRGLAPAAIVIGASAAFGWRAWQVFGTLRELQALMEGHK